MQCLATPLASKPKVTATDRRCLPTSPIRPETFLKITCTLVKAGFDRLSRRAY